MDSTARNAVRCATDVSAVRSAHDAAARFILDVFLTIKAGDRVKFIRGTGFPSCPNSDRMGTLSHRFETAS